MSATQTWLGDIASSYKAGFEEESIARFGQYLLERGRLKWSEAPVLLQTGEPEGEFRLPQLVQRLLAEKLGILASDPTPLALAFITHPEAVSESLEKYLAGTDRYRAKLQEWEQALKSDPEAKRPEPTELAGECATKLFVFGPPGNPHLTAALIDRLTESSHVFNMKDCVSLRTRMEVDVLRAMTLCCMPSLGRQRRDRAKLPVQKRKQLEAVGFCWDIRQSTWDHRFEELKEYKRRHGDCNVSRSSDASPRLCGWVFRQRNRKHTLGPERIRKLDELGFAWQVLGAMPANPTDRDPKNGKASTWGISSDLWPGNHVKS